MMKHVITVMVENQPGVLARIVGLISGRGFNIETLNVGPTQDATVSRMTIQVPGDDRVLEQVTKQLNKLVDVIRVTDLTKKRYLDRELVLIKVAATASKRSEVLELASVFGARVIGVQLRTMTVELSGDREQVEDFVELLKPFKILELSRSGVLAVAKGD